MRLLLILFAAVALLPSSGHAAENLPPVIVRPLAAGVWLHSSYRVIEPWGPILSNGLIVDEGDGVWLIDTAWTNEQTREVLRLAADAIGRPVTHAVFTHAHDDKMGGVQTLLDAGVETFALARSNELAQERGLVPAAHDLIAEDAGDLAWPENEPAGLKAFFPGPGHTEDNIVVSIPSAGVLFGGCLIRPRGAADLGNTEDADIGSWADSVRRASHRYPAAQIVVPSHAPPGGRELLTHTIGLAAETDRERR